MFTPNPNRYQTMTYNRCGKSGLKLPAISLGMWHNFGSVDDFENARSMMRKAFDLGITHFDLANNYGPEPGTAESNFGRIFSEDFAGHRDELIVSSKAGYFMWDGPYGDWGSRKYLIASCDQSLRRMRVNYLDIFYHHRPDPETPIEESMLALDQIVRSGKALYAGISNYGPEATMQAVRILRELKTPFVINQIRFNMFDRTHEDNGLLPLLEREGIGGIIFSPLAQGLLTDRYLNGIPEDSRASRNHFLRRDLLTEELVRKISTLNAIAARRGQTLSQMAIAWALSRPGVTAALIGASRPSQIEDIVQCLNRRTFSRQELLAIDVAVKGEEQP